MAIVDQIRIDTTLLPSFTIDQPFSSSPSASPSKIMDILKPKLTITTGYSSSPVVVAPYGDPGVTQWPWMAAAGLGLVGLMVLWKMKR